jgi:hypothetical protein
LPTLTGIPVHCFTRARIECPYLVKPALPVKSKKHSSIL